MEKVKNLSKCAGKCDDQQQHKDIIRAAMISTTKGLTDNRPISLRTSAPVNKPSAIKPLRQFSEVLDVKHKNAVPGLGYSKSKRKYTAAGDIIGSIITKRHGKTKINALVIFFYIIVSYSILRPRNCQLKMIALRCTLMVTLKNRWFQIYY